MVDEITVRGFSFPGRSNGRKRSGGNDSAGAQRGAAKKAARLFPWTGAENVGIGGRSCGAFNAPRRAFVRSEDCPQNGAGNISPAIDGITVSGFPFSHRSDGRNRSGGNESTGATRAVFLQRSERSPFSSQEDGPTVSVKRLRWPSPWGGSARDGFSPLRTERFLSFPDERFSGSPHLLSWLEPAGSFFPWRLQFFR